MKFGIVGPISKDHVVLPSGTKVDKYGAIAYSTLALAKLVEDTPDQIICLSHVARADFDAIEKLLRHPNISLSYVMDGIATKGTEIELIYINQQERIGRQISTMSPITAAELVLLKDCESVLLMPLNESDITLACAIELRRVSTAFILLDVHGLVTTVNETGNRVNQPWQNAEKWFACIDVLKMNAKEVPWVAGHYIDQDQDYVDYAISVVQHGVTACWITFGDQSSLIAWRREGRFYWAKVPVVTDIGSVVDTTGCGDSASAGFMYSYARLQNPLIAVTIGNTLGSLKASFQGFNGFPSPPEVRGMMQDHYKNYLHQLLDDVLFKSQLMIHEVKGECKDESFMFNPDGNRHHYGSDYAGGSHS
ncbi:MAG TPA: PfkB family carbohydrate kinase [Negativicutes bacterium]|jgi:hypothetical protein